MEINKDNYRKVLISYLENELAPADRAAAEQYIRENEEAALEWHLLKQTRLKPDLSIGFPSKKMLYRQEVEEVVAAPVVKTFKLKAVYRYSALAVAAAFLVFAVILITKKPGTDIATSYTGTTNNPIAVPDKQPKTDNKENKGAGKNGTTAPGTNDNPKKDAPKNLPADKKKKDGKTPSTPSPERRPSIIIVNQPDPPRELATLKQGNKTIATPDTKDNTINGTGHFASFNPEMKMTAYTGGNQPTRQPARQEEHDKSLLEELLAFSKKVKVNKKNINDKTYYALSIETNGIKIDKTFKSLTDK